MQLKNLTISLALCSLLILSGCLGTSVLKRGNKNEETPSLHTVPERPETLATKERAAATQDMQSDFQETSKGLE